MKKLGLMLITLFFVAALNIAAQDNQNANTSEDKGGPILRFDCGSTYDWGDVKYKESPVKCAVKIFNDGDAPLKINKVKPGCGCTTTELDKDEIAPGDFATIEMKLNLKNHPGKTTKSVAFYTNDPKREKHILFLKANVLTGYSVTPNRMRFYNSTVGEAMTTKMLFENTSGTEIKLGDIQVRPDDLIISGIEKGQVIKNGETVAIEATYTPTKAGRISTYVTINTVEHPDIDVIRIYGNGQATEQKAANPDSDAQGK